MNKFEFHQEIETFVKDNNVDYIDAVLHYCSLHNLEIETVGSFISKDLNLVSKIQSEAEELHFMKKTSTLPI